MKSALSPYHIFIVSYLFYSYQRRRCFLSRRGPPDPGTASMGMVTSKFDINSQQDLLQVFAD